MGYARSLGDCHGMSRLVAKLRRMDWDDLDSSSYRDTLSYNACIADTWSYLLVIVVKIRNTTFNVPR
jgi:hypothetical protein